MSVNKHYCQGTNCHTNQTQDIINNRPINFITERRTSDGYEMKTEHHSYGTYKTISKINSQNS